MQREMLKMNEKQEHLFEEVSFCLSYSLQSLENEAGCLFLNLSLHPCQSVFVISLGSSFESRSLTVFKINVLSLLTTKCTQHSFEIQRTCSNVTRSFNDLIFPILQIRRLKFQGVVYLSRVIQLVSGRIRTLCYFPLSVSKQLVK